MSINLENLEDSVSLWDKELVIPLLTSLKLAPGTAEYVQLMNTPTSSYAEDHNPSGIPLYQPSYPTNQKILRCSYCETTFNTREEQVAHYSQDWHRFNLKRSMQGFSSIPHEQFINETWQEQEEEQVGDDSGAEEEEESSDDENIVIQRKPRVIFVNVDNEVISIFRTILHHKKAEFFNEAELIQRVFIAVRKLYWTVILVGGGHFAAAVFKGPDVIAHKTFHSYTVRAKQGGTQSSRDNKNATTHPRSAGASLRRFNEQAHNQHVQELLDEWKEHIAMCDLILCRCPKNNSNLLFGGQTPILLKRDERLRTIPFPTKKPSFAEVRKVHRTLSQIYIHGKVEDVLELEREKCSIKKVSSLSPSKGVCKREEKSEKSPKKLSKDEIAGLDTHEVSLLGKSSSEEDVGELTTAFETINTSFLQPFGSSVEDNRAKKKKYKKKKTRTDSCDQEKSLVNANESKGSSPEMRKIENFVYSTCRTGNLHQLKAIYQFSELRDLTEVRKYSWTLNKGTGNATEADTIPNYVIEAMVQMDQSYNLLGIKFGMHEKTLLHVAAENAHKEVIWWLLDQGCDPCVKNKQSETPYAATKIKEARNHFRRYMAAYPQKYDYEKANIPEPLMREQELQQKAKQVEKRKQQKKGKREKEKEMKREEERKRKEEEEKEKFLRLSDREKRALAAEKRILAAQTEELKSLPILRCFQCAEDISKIVPFEYCDFKFCSTVCVREHRTKNQTTVALRL